VAVVVLRDVSAVQVHVRRLAEAVAEGDLHRPARGGPDGRAEQVAAVGEHRGPQARHQLGAPRLDVDPVDVAARPAPDRAQLAGHRHPHGELVGDDPAAARGADGVRVGHAVCQVMGGVVGAVHGGRVAHGRRQRGGAGQHGRATQGAAEHE
jgi:hypothetical protein